MPKEAIRVLIIDDHQVVIDGLNQMLAADIYIKVVGDARSLGEARAQLKRTEVDVALLDISLPDGSGVDFCKEVKKFHPNVQIIALTMYDQNSFITQMLKNGAKGYLLKNTKGKELINAIKLVQNGENYLSEQVSQSVINGMFNKDKNSEGAPRLTRREKEVLQFIAKEHTTQEIANQLFISLNTVESHRRNLLSKFGVRNSIGLVLNAKEKGYLDE